MSATVTIDWRESRLSYQRPWTATLVFHVDGVEHDDEALTAVDATTGLAVANRGDEHPRSGRLLCNGPVIREKKGPKYWIIQCDYTVPPNGSMPGGGVEPDPLDELPRWRWDTLELAEPVDTDLDGRVIENTAGEPYEPQTRPIAAKRFIYIRNFPYYDAAQAEQYENSENGEAVTLPDGTVVAAYHCLCKTICPADEQSAASTYVTVVMTFTVILGNQLGGRPFQHRLLSMGRIGWRDQDGKTTKGSFTTLVNGAPQPIPVPILLDSSGLPLQSGSDFVDGDITVEGKTPIANPTVRPSLDFETYDDGRIARIFRAVRTTDHNALFA